MNAPFGRLGAPPGVVAMAPAISPYMIAGRHSPFFATGPGYTTPTTTTTTGASSTDLDPGDPYPTGGIPTVGVWAPIPIPEDKPKVVRVVQRAPEGPNPLVMLGLLGVVGVGMFSLIWFTGGRGRRRERRF